MSLQYRKMNRNLQICTKKHFILKKKLAEMKKKIIGSQKTAKTLVVK